MLVSSRLPLMQSTPPPSGNIKMHFSSPPCQFFWFFFCLVSLSVKRFSDWLAAPSCHRIQCNLLEVGLPYLLKLDNDLGKMQPVFIELVVSFLGFMLGLEIVVAILHPGSEHHLCPLPLKLKGIRSPLLSCAILECWHHISISTANACAAVKQGLA